MLLHYLQHVPFEGPAAILDWAVEHQHQVSSTRLYDPDDHLPSQQNFDCLVVMGGPMGVSDTALYPWLTQEAEFIRQAVHGNKKVLGVCLGAQLIASALGAKIRKNADREIGWFPLTTDPAIVSSRFADIFTDDMSVFHWHGDTFDLPENAHRIASSQACLNQGFIIDDRVIALQFHLETTADSARLLVENCRNELDGSRYVQTEKDILNDPVRFTAIRETLFSLLDTLAE